MKLAAHPLFITLGLCLFTLISAQTPGQSCPTGECDDGISCGVDSVCGGNSADCSTDSDCESGFNCDSMTCTNSNPVQPGGTCSTQGNAGQCDGGVICSSGTCGGVGASCYAFNVGPNGDSDFCQSGLTCRNNACAEPPAPGPIGADCTTDADCEAGPQSCSAGKCGGEGAYCGISGDKEDPTFPGTGANPRCVGGFCLIGQCSSVPASTKTGMMCGSDTECGGATCSSDGICGGAGASCVANGGGDTGDLGICASDKCSGGSCTTAPSIKTRRSTLQQPVRGTSPCTGSQVACPLLSGRGWDCIDPFNDIESCGGCIFASAYANQTGQDCTAMMNTDWVSCEKGLCHVYTCLEGFILDKEGKACVGNLPA